MVSPPSQNKLVCLLRAFMLILVEYFRIWLVAKLKSIYNRLGDKHSSLLGPCVSYEENKVLKIWLQCMYSQPFIF
jgi:hypothetical protein